MSVTSVSTRRPESLRSLERGLAVIQAFSTERPALTISEIAQRTDISRASVRRILLALEDLGYVRADGRAYSLAPRVLTLGWAYLSSLGVPDAQPLLEGLVERAGESVALSTLDLPDIVCVASVPARRIMRAAPRVGVRLPAHATAAGVVLLAELPPAELDRYLAETELEQCTACTVTDRRRLRARLDRVREQGWAVVDNELELGLRALAAPVACPEGSILAAISLPAAALPGSIEAFQAQFLPMLLETAGRISALLRRRDGSDGA